MSLLNDYEWAEKTMNKAISLRGARIYPGFLEAAAQQALVGDLREVVRAAPLFAPRTARGAMSVRMTAAGRFGWVSDGTGYRYAARHPSGAPWPPIPEPLLRLWEQLAEYPRAPECCLVNFYGPEARMGMHQDRDEADFSAPVLSISLGDEALFRIGNETRGGKTESIWLRSGDVLLLGGKARLLHHGVDRLRPGSSTLLPRGGRINVTLRVVT